MSRKVVRRSIDAPDGVHCVDLLEGRPGAFAFALCRRDPEDPHGWRVLPGLDGGGYGSLEDARDAARAVAPWLPR